MQDLQLLHVIPAASRWTHKAAALHSFHCIKQKLQAAVASSAAEQSSFQASE